MSTTEKWALAVSWLLYIVIWDGGIIAGCAYIVFGLGHSGWWFVLAVFLCTTSFKPHTWNALFTGKKPK